MMAPLFLLWNILWKEIRVLYKKLKNRPGYEQSMTLVPLPSLSISFSAAFVGAGLPFEKLDHLSIVGFLHKYTAVAGKHLLIMFLCAMPLGITGNPGYAGGGGRGWSGPPTPPCLKQGVPQTTPPPMRAGAPKKGDFRDNSQKYPKMPKNAPKCPKMVKIEKFGLGAHFLGCFGVMSNLVKNFGW